MDLQKRVVNIITNPKAEWPVIAAESTDAATITREYLVIMAAIPAVATFVGFTVIGVSGFFGTYRSGIVPGFVNAVVQYVLTIVGVHVAAMIIDKLAPNFQSQPSAIQALKLVAYGNAPAFAAGILNVIPMLAPLGILAALYAIYVCYLGLPIMMKTPADQTVAYMVVSAVVIIVVMLVIGALAGVATGFAGGLRAF